MNLGRSTLYNLLGAAVPLLVSIVTVPRYLHVIGVDRYGVLSIAWLLLGYFGLFDLGLGRATSFRIAALRDASPQARADTFVAALSVNAVVGCAGGAALWAAAYVFFRYMFKVDNALRPEIIASVPYLAASLPVATLTGVVTGALQGREKFFATNAVSIISTPFLQLLPLLTAIMTGPNLPLQIASALLVRIVTFLALAILCHLEIGKGQARRLARGEVPLLMKYGGWVTLTSIFGPVLVLADRFAIGAVLGAAAVATYTVAYQLVKQTAMLPSALTNALFPRLSAASPTQRSQLGEKATRALSSLMTLPVLFGIFLVDPFLRAWIGPALAEQASPVSRALLVGFWANAFALVPFSTLQAAGRPDLVTKVLIGEIPPHLISLFPAMRWFGALGAAWAVTARFIADYVLLAFVADRNFRGWRVLAINFVILCLAIWQTSIWKFDEPVWWVAASILTFAALVAAWLAAPGELRELLDRITRRYLPRPT